MTTIDKEANQGDGLEFYEDALGSLFGLGQPAEGTAHAQLTFDHAALPATIAFTIPDVAAENAQKAAQYQWASGRLMARLLADGYAHRCAGQHLPSLAPPVEQSDRAQEEHAEQDELRALPSQTSPSERDALLRALDVRDRSVLELGAGTGLPSLVATHLGARTVCSLVAFRPPRS